MACSLLVALAFLLSITLAGSPFSLAQAPAVESGGASSTRVVTTAQEFFDAFKQGTMHIVVAAHLDLSHIQGDLVIENKGYDFDRPIVELNGTASVRGACTGVPAPEQPLAPPLQSAAACHILIKEDFMALTEAAASKILWLHDLYLEVHRDLDRPASQVAMLFNAGAADLWATQCVFRGDGVNSRFLEVGPDRRLYLRDVTITEFSHFVHPGVRLYHGTMATLLRVTVTGNVATKVRNSAKSPLHNGPVIGMISGTLRRCQAWLYDCALSGNVADAADGAAASSDNTRNNLYSNSGEPRIWVTLDGLASKVADPRTMTAEAFADGSIHLFPSEADAVFQTLASEEYLATGLSEVVPAELPSPASPRFRTTVAPAAVVADGGGGSGGRGGAVLGAVVGGCVAATLLGVGIVALLFMRWRRKPLLGKPQPGSAAGDMEAARPAAPLAPLLGAPQPTGPSGPLIRALAQSHSIGTDGLTAFSRSTGGTTTVVANMPMAGDGPSGRVIVADEQLESALDSMHARGDTLMDVYELHGVASRRRGGQGVVQFARRIQNGAEYAIKFFTDSRAFSRELSLYRNPTLRAMMPAVSAVQDNADGGIQDSAGYVFPPFIVVERGESLNEWVDRVAPDFVTSMFVLCHVTKRLQLLHSAGLCHRDLKPGNILWRPTANAWTLIDFGCAEPIGEECPLLFSLHYAPPEVVLAASAAQRTTVADPKVDIWALGLVAFELLTGTRVFSAQAGRAEVLPLMSGAQHLPWEVPGKAGVLRKLGVLRRTVLGCLARDPRERPSSAEVLRSWNGMFESQTATRTGLLEDCALDEPPLRLASLVRSMSREASGHIVDDGSASGRGVPALGQGGMRTPAGAALSPRSMTRSSRGLSPAHATAEDGMHTHASYTAGSTPHAALDTT